MAVDTRDKRFSMLGLAQAQGFPTLVPNPDNAITTGADFTMRLYGYYGIPFAGAGDPRMMRWGGVKHMTNKSFAGRGW